MAGARKSEMPIIAMIGATTERTGSKGALLYQLFPKQGERSD